MSKENINYLLGFTLFALGVFFTFTIAAVELEKPVVYNNPEYWLFPSMLSMILSYLIWQYLMQSGPKKKLLQPFLSPRFWGFLLIILLIVPQRWH